MSAPDATLAVVNPLPPVHGRLLAAWIPPAGLELAAVIAHAGQLTGYVRIPYGLAVRMAGCPDCRNQLGTAARVAGETYALGRWLGVVAGGPDETGDDAIGEAMELTNRVADAVAMVAGLGGCWACSEQAAIL